LASSGTAKALSLTRDAWYVGIGESAPLRPVPGPASLPAALRLAQPESSASSRGGQGHAEDLAPLVWFQTCADADGVALGRVAAADPSA
jgi:hypothetical protein